MSLKVVRRFYGWTRLDISPSLERKQSSSYAFSQILHEAYLSLFAYTCIHVQSYKMARQFRLRLFHRQLQGPSWVSPPSSPEFGQAQIGGFHRKQLMFVTWGVVFTLCSKLENLSSISLSVKPGTSC